MYLYEESASNQKYKNLANIRRGEYEDVENKIKTLEPTYSVNIKNIDTQKNILKSGVITIGARNFLIAYNINVNTKSLEKAKIIAKNIRESSGGLDSVKSIAWYIKEYKTIQISCNLTNYKKTSLHKLYETCKREARSLSIKTTGSELIGLIPKEAILEVGRYYYRYAFKEKGCAGYNDEELILLAIEKLGLNSVRKFDKKNILENNI